MAFFSKRSDERIASRRAVKVFVGIVIGLLLANIWGYFAFPVGSPLSAFLDVNGEENLATAFSVFLLLFCALLLWQISRRLQGDRFFQHWRILSLLFFAMAADEWLLLHERVNMFLDDRWQTTGLFYYDWVIPGSLFVMVVGLLYARFLWHLPRRTRRRVLFAGGLYIAGVLGMEMVSGYYIDSYGTDQRGVLAVLNGVEEAAEMFGLIAFAHALLTYAQLLSESLSGVAVTCQNTGRNTDRTDPSLYRHNASGEKNREGNSYSEPTDLTLTAPEVAEPMFTDPMFAEPSADARLSRRGAKETQLLPSDLLPSDVEEPKFTEVK